MASLDEFLERYPNENDGFELIKLLEYQSEVPLPEWANNSFPVPEEIEISYPISISPEAIPNVTVRYRTGGHLTFVQLLNTIAKFYDQTIPPETIQYYLQEDPETTFTEEDLENPAPLYNALLGRSSQRTYFQGIDGKNGKYEVMLDHV